MTQFLSGKNTCRNKPQKEQKKKSSCKTGNFWVCYIYSYCCMKNTTVGYTGCCRGARDVMVIVVGNWHGDTSSNSGRDLLHFTLH